MDAGRANKEAELLRKQCKALCQELKEALQEADVAKCRRDWAFQERDKIVAERDSIRYREPLAWSGLQSPHDALGLWGGSESLATCSGEVRVASVPLFSPGVMAQPCFIAFEVSIMSLLPILFQPMCLRVHRVFDLLGSRGEQRGGY